MLKIWCVFAVIGVLLFYYKDNYSEESDKIEEQIGDVTWDTGVDRKTVRLLIYCMFALFGWIIIPYVIIKKIFHLFNAL